MKLFLEGTVFLTYLTLVLGGAYWLLWNIVPKIAGDIILFTLGG